jgi:MFS family permease
MGAAESLDPRDESEAERDDRNLAELLQELRVAGLGVQVLFGFLLSLPFTTRFTQLSHGQRNLYLGSLVLAAVATALLLAPVAYHRLVFRRGQKERLVRAANVMAILGLAAVGLAVSAAVLLVTGYVVGGPAAALITVLVFCMFGGLWFAFPLAHRRLPGPGPCAQASRSIGQLMQRGPPRPRPSSPPGTVITSMPFSCR